MHSMFTVCPKCTLTLAVTAEDLRTGQGYVRCGRCLNVFNALLALSEDPADSEAQPAYSQADPASQSQITHALSSAQHAPAHSGPLSDDSQRASLPTEVSSDGAIETESSLADGTGTFETIVLEGDGYMQTEEFAPQESVDNEIAAIAERLDAQSNQIGSANDDETDEPAINDHSPGSTDTQTEVASDEAAEAVVFEAPASEPASAGQRRRWMIGCTLLLLLLASQIVNHWRDSLASTRALSTPMTRLYASIGVPIDPHWDLSAYDIRQQGAASDPGDTRLIRVRISIANRAARAQPVPLLRLTLLDRYGKLIAARDLTPAEYWPHDRPMPSLLQLDERVDSEVAVRDPGADSSSFELDVCLKNVHGAIRCAGDASATATGTP
jgi:predicted Zn finger-like uncharacterized protein